MDGLNSHGILCGKRSEHAHPETAQKGNRLQVRLNPCPSSGIRSGNRQYPFHPSLLICPRFRAHTNKKAVIPMNGITAFLSFYRFPSLELPEQVQRVSLLPLKEQGLSAQVSSPSYLILYSYKRI